MNEAENALEDTLENVATLERPKPANYRKEILVGGYKYIATHPDPETAYAMGIELTQLIGESIAAMAPAEKQTSQKQAEEESAKALQNAARIFLAKIPPSVMLNLLKRVLKYVELQKNDNNPTKTMLTDAAVKLHFQGRHGDMFQVFIESLVFQQADFFLAMKRTLKEIMTKMRD